MPKLGDLRASLRSGELEAKLEEKKDQENNRYKINASGTDALIKFGRHRGLTLKQIKVSDPSYLDFIRTNSFPTELKDVVRYIQGLDQVDAISKAAKSIGEFGRCSVAPIARKERRRF